MSKKVISFSLWGKNPKYTIGAVKNCLLARQVYPDWICRIYYGRSVPEYIISVLSELSNVELMRMSESGDWTGMFWRFLAASDPEVSVMISRDTDSRLSFREKKCVDAWLESDKDVHSIRDHNGHDIPMLGGMWGSRNGVLKDIDRMIVEFKKGNFWQVDQNFLTQKVYPIVKDKMISHDDFYKHKFPNSFPIPHKKDCSGDLYYEFVGKPYESNDISCHDNRKWCETSVWK